MPRGFVHSLQQRLAGAFPWMARLRASTAVRRFGRALWWTFWIVYFSFVALVLALRYSILPNIEVYRPSIERLAGRALGQTVSIGRIEASWDGINPDFDLFDVRVLDAEGRPALAFSRVEAVVSWLSVPSGTLKLRLLRIDQPTLNLRRDADGRFFIAGIALADDEASGSAFSDWVFAQRRIRIHNATLIWEDALRQAPALRLEALNFGLDNFGRRRRFGLTAQPPAALASHIDIRGDFSGSDIDRLDDWKGHIFTEIDYVDLAAWRQWIDYPLTLLRGQGTLRLWAGIKRGALREMTADLLLRDVAMQLHTELPILALTEASGRVSVQRTDRGIVASGSKLALMTASQPTPAAEAAASEAADPGADTAAGVRIAPMDFRLAWNTDAQENNASGSLTANQIDLGALSQLTAYLPLAADVRQFLATYHPRGQLSGLDARWQGDAVAGNLKTYALESRFQRLALNAQGDLPGFAGLSGEASVNEKGGHLTLDSTRASIDLPGVFPVARTELERLDAQARWTLGEAGLDVDLTRLAFANAEAAGSAAGVYRKQGEGPGYIDLKATLTHADARAVWRYIPHTVGDATRNWLRDSLISGKAGEAKLTLKGNLADFPFLDPAKGQFLVTVKAEDVVLDYANGWPRIEHIYGNLRFAGAGMVVDAQRGTILGAKLGATRAEIPDLDLDTPVIEITGQAEGPTAEFLKFIDQSPVAERIDRFTEGMRASGIGHLDIALKIPLDEQQLNEAKIKGEYRFQNNTVSVDTALPPLRQVNGSIRFSGSELNLPEIRASLFGGPLSIKGGLQKDGRVLITLNGTANVDQLRQPNGAGAPVKRPGRQNKAQGEAAEAQDGQGAESFPLLAHLSGSAAYRGEVRINKRDADLVINSSLTGLRSTLPEPFGKAANESLPLRFEKRILTADAAGAMRDQLLASLGQKLSFQAIRHRQGGSFVVERAALGIGRAQALPDKGFIVGVSAPRIDLDLWRTLFQTDSGGNAQSGQAAAGLMPNAVSLATPELRAFGRLLNDVSLNAEAASGQWQLHLDSRQAGGEIRWDGAGRGKLTARLKQLIVDPEESENAVTAEEKEAMKELPALDVVAEDFRFGKRRFGRLELQAVNAGEAWDLNKVQMNAPHGILTGKGQWRMTPGLGRTHLNFTLNSDDVGKLLDQLGYVGMISGGTAKLAGRLDWPGAPTGFELAALDGALSLEAGRGQFLKVKPGAGRLLGLISLQSLPRRISLDFRDVFSAGFAFDSIAGDLALKGGVMRTERLQIDGPAARVLMRGETDLKRETQRLFVTVQPELGTTAALGVALVNPVAGVATLLANKLLQDPLNQMFGFDYLVTGSWDDPKVEKLGRQAAKTAADAAGKDAAGEKHGHENAAAANGGAAGQAVHEAVDGAAAPAPLTDSAQPASNPAAHDTETKDDAAHE